MNEEKYQKPKSPEEQESIRQAVALAQAVAYVTHRLLPKNDLVIADVPYVLSVAQDFLVWLRGSKELTMPPTIAGKASGGAVEPQSDDLPMDMPVPTLVQKAVLNEIVKQTSMMGLGKKIIYKRVLDWAEKITGKRIYPQNLASVEKFIQFYEKTK